MKELSKIYKLKSIIAPKMTYIITFPDNNGKYVLYTGGNIRRIYYYLVVIGAPTILNTSFQCSHNFVP